MTKVGTPTFTTDRGFTFPGGAATALTTGFSLATIRRPSPWQPLVRRLVSPVTRRPAASSATQAGGFRRRRRPAPRSRAALTPLPRRRRIRSTPPDEFWPSRATTTARTTNRKWEPRTSPSPWSSPRSAAPWKSAASAPLPRHDRREVRLRLRRAKPLQAQRDALRSRVRTYLSASASPSRKGFPMFHSVDLLRRNPRLRVPWLVDPLARRLDRSAPSS